MPNTHDWTVERAYDLANTIANHGWTPDANSDLASECIYALCRKLQSLGNAAALREALTAFVGYLTQKRIDEVWAKTTLPEPGLDRLVEQARAALAAPPEPPSNAAAMRAALEEAQALLLNIDFDADSGLDDDAAPVMSDIGHALAAPARNCDVGTADEQAERFEAECHRHDHCTPCPVHRVWGEFKKGKPKSCQLIWAQMPFVPVEGGAE